MEAEEASSENAAIEIGTDFAFDEASNGCSLFARVGEECLEALSDDFNEKSLVWLVTLVVDQVDPVRDRVRVRRASVDELGVSVCAQPLEPGVKPNQTEDRNSLRV